MTVNRIHIIIIINMIMMMLMILIIIVVVSNCNNAIAYNNNNYYYLFTYFSLFKAEDKKLCVLMMSTAFGYVSHEDLPGS